MFQALGGQDRYPAVLYDLPQWVSPCVLAPLLRQSGSASANLFSLILVALTASSEPPPSAGYQSGSARVGRH